MFPVVLNVLQKNMFLQTFPIYLGPKTFLFGKRKFSTANLLEKMKTRAYPQLCFLSKRNLFFEHEIYMFVCCEKYSPWKEEEESQNAKNQQPLLRFLLVIGWQKKRRSLKCSNASVV
jgi:hypothetical protein